MLRNSKGDRRLIDEMKNNNKDCQDQVYLSPRKNDHEKTFFEILKIDPVNWAPPFRMNKSFLEKKYHELVRILEQNRIYIEFAEKLPISEAYRYLNGVYRLKT